MAAINFPSTGLYHGYCVVSRVNGSRQEWYWDTVSTTWVSVTQLPKIEFIGYEGINSAGQVLASDIDGVATGDLIMGFWTSDSSTAPTSTTGLTQEYTNGTAPKSRMYYGTYGGTQEISSSSDASSILLAFRRAAFTTTQYETGGVNQLGAPAIAVGSPSDAVIATLHIDDLNTNQDSVTFTPYDYSGGNIMWMALDQGGIPLPIQEINAGDGSLAIAVYPFIGPIYNWEGGTDFSPGQFYGRPSGEAAYVTTTRLTFV